MILGYVYMNWGFEICFMKCNIEFEGQVSIWLVIEERRRKDKDKDNCTQMKILCNVCIFINKSMIYSMIYYSMINIQDFKEMNRKMHCQNIGPAG